MLSGIPQIHLDVVEQDTPRFIQKRRPNIHLADRIPAPVLPDNQKPVTLGVVDNPRRFLGFIGIVDREVGVENRCRPSGVQECPSEREVIRSRSSIRPHHEVPLGTRFGQIDTMPGGVACGNKQNRNDRRKTAKEKVPTQVEMHIAVF